MPHRYGCGKRRLLMCPTTGRQRTDIAADSMRRSNACGAVTCRRQPAELTLPPVPPTFKQEDHHGVRHDRSAPRSSRASRRLPRDTSSARPELGQKQIREIVYVQFTHGMVRLRLDTSVIDWHPERHEVKDPTGMRVKLVGIPLLVIDHFLPGIPAVSHPLDVDLPRLPTIADQYVSWLRLLLAVHALLAERLDSHSR